MKLKTSMIRVDKVIAMGGSYDEVESKIGMEEVDQDIKIEDFDHFILGPDDEIATAST